MRSLRRDARRIFERAIGAVNPCNILSKSISLQRNLLKVGKRSYALCRFDRIFVAGAGKASAAMAANLEKILGSRIDGGIVNVKYGHGRKLRYIRVQEAGHPLPDEKGLCGTREILLLLSNLTERDLVIFLISGGGSALLPSPLPGMTLEEKQRVTDLLLKCGAKIQEINTIRKHLSSIKGGGLARAVYPATLISLILSDVIGDPLETIASGPTVADETTFGDCGGIFDRYGLWERVPLSVAQQIREGMEGRREETLKAGDPVFERVYNLVVANNRLAMKAGKKEAENLGYHALMISSMIEGETREVAKVHAAIAKEVVLSGNPLKPPACILSGGETTLRVQGSGKGGRNQEFALAAALEIDGWQEILVFSAGTDGTDGPTDAAGAFADGETVRRGKLLGLDPWTFLGDNNSYAFFKKLGDLLFSGPTGTNVMDMRIMLIGERRRLNSGRPHRGKKSGLR